MASTTAAQAITPAPACGNSSLQVTHTPVDGAAGHSAFVLLFRNVTSHTCSLNGYPGLDAMNASGHAIAHAHRALGGFGGPTPTTGSAGQRSFISAQTRWLAGASATSADQPAYWLAAAHDLQDTWTTAAAEPNDLAGLPDAMQTPAQAEAVFDTKQLNRFFVTPGLYLT